MTSWSGAAQPSTVHRSHLLGCHFLGSVVNSIFPSFHISVIPYFRHSIFPSFHISVIAYFRHCIFPSFPRRRESRIRTNSVVFGPKFIRIPTLAGMTADLTTPPTVTDIARWLGLY